MRRRMLLGTTSPQAFQMWERQLDESRAYTASRWVLA